MTATPRPWRVGKRRIIHDGGGGQRIAWDDEPLDDARPLPAAYGTPIGEEMDITIHGPNGAVLATVDGVGTMPDLRANADLIVRAVNAFDALHYLAAAVAYYEAVGHPIEAPRVREALVELDAKHPGWREWTP